MKIRYFAVSILAVSILITSCGVGGGGSGGSTDAQSELQAEINQRFPYVENQPLDQLFVCSITGSSLSWYLNFFPAGNMEIYTALDNGDDLLRNGSYSHANNTLTLDISNDALVIQESSTQITVALGLISRFTSPNMQCATAGHRYNSQEFSSLVNFSCPDTNIQAVSRDSNAIEFVHNAVPFSFSVAGSAFRQRDRFISGATGPFITRGYGIYRRAGDDFFIFFDFDQFDDIDFVSGLYGQNDFSITPEQSFISTSACTRN